MSAAAPQTYNELHAGTEYDEEVAYIEYCNAKRAKRTGAQLVWYFGSRLAARFELRWQADQAAEKIESEAFPAPSDDEIYSYRAPLSCDDPCELCHRKFCPGNCDGGDQRAGR